MCACSCFGDLASGGLRSLQVRNSSFPDSPSPCLLGPRVRAAETAPRSQVVLSGPPARPRGPTLRERPGIPILSQTRVLRAGLVPSARPPVCLVWAWDCAAGRLPGAAGASGRMAEPQAKRGRRGGAGWEGSATSLGKTLLTHSREADDVCFPHTGRCQAVAQLLRGAIWARLRLPLCRCQR